MAGLAQARVPENSRSTERQFEEIRLPVFVGELLFAGRLVGCARPFVVRFQLLLVPVESFRPQKAGREDRERGSSGRNRPLPLRCDSLACRPERQHELYTSARCRAASCGPEPRLKTPHSRRQLTRLSV